MAAPITPPLEAASYHCTFPEALSRFVRGYLRFSGRAGRAEFWWVQLVLSTVSTVLQLPSLPDDSATGLSTGTIVSTVLLTLWNLAVLLPSLALLWRRLHDTGRSGVWVLIGLVPLAGAIVLLVFALLPPVASNQYGPGPEVMPSHVRRL